MTILSPAYSGTERAAQMYRVEEETETAELLRRQCSPELSVCFVCSGNTCRSPMAEVMLSGMAGNGPVDYTDAKGITRRYSRVRTSSAGLFAVPGDRISPLAVQALTEAGFCETEEKVFVGRQARLLTPEEVRRSDVLIAMSPEHLLFLLSKYPDFRDRFRCMPEPVPDPFGGGIGEYRECLGRIRENLRILFFSEGATDADQNHTGK